MRKNEASLMAALREIASETIRTTLSENPDNENEEEEEEEEEEEDNEDPDNEAVSFLIFVLFSSSFRYALS